MTYANFRKAAPRPSRQSPQQAPASWVDLDPLFDSKKIYKLNVLNFKRFVSGKEKALVMFYDSRKGNNPSEQTLFTDVANASFTEKFGFGAVDCATDFPVCIRHSGCDTPMFKLYSNGYELSAIKDPTKINIEQMRMLMKMTPVLVQPRGSLGRNISITPSETTETEKPSSSSGGKGFFAALKKKF